MRIIDIWKVKIPKTCHFLATDLPELTQSNSKIWRAFLGVSGLTENDAKQTITDNSIEPLIWFSPLGLRTGGYFDPSVSGRISLSFDIALKFEVESNNQIAQHFMRLLALHEICHWAWHKQKKPDPDLAGEKFELESGENIDYSWLSFAQSLNQTAEDRVIKLKESLVSGISLTPSIDIFDGADVAKGMKRGIRNNNPGNIRIGDPWIGLAERSRMTDFQKMESSFCVFCEPEWGLRAMIAILRKYQDKYKLFTLYEIISRWAPPEDNNDVTSYATSIAGAVGISATDRIYLSDDNTMISILKAMGKHENGIILPYSEIQYRAALKLASN